MNWLKNFSIKELFANKKFAVSFSVLVAFVFWLIIVIDQNPEREVTFNSVPVSINATGTSLESLNMEVVSHNVGDSVSVTVKGPSYVVSSLKSDDILVTVDFSNVDKPGEYVLNLVARKMSGKSDYEVVAINPSAATVIIDKMVDEYMDVEVYAPNISPDIASDPALGIEPLTLSDRIHIKGPQSEFDKISRVVAVINDTALLTSSKTFDARIVLYNSDNEEISKDAFSLSATNVQVTARVYKRVTVPITPVFLNKPDYAPDLSYTITLESGEFINEIDVQGEPELINSLTALKLNPIDFTEISKSKTTFVVGLNLASESLKLPDNITNVTVKFNLSSYTQKSLALDVQVSNASNGLTIDRQSLKNVTFVVPRNKASGFDASDVTASVDLSGKSAGDTVQVVFKSKVNGVWVNGSYTVKVKAK